MSAWLIAAFVAVGALLGAGVGAAAAMLMRRPEPEMTACQRLEEWERFVATMQRMSRRADR